jgi:hypothetical protein
MPKLRSSIVVESVTPWYHCISRCVRREPLCGGGFAYRKKWIEDRLKELAEIFSIECAGFAVIDNHLHLLLRLDSRQAERWTGEEVARRWLELFPLRDVTGKALPVTGARIRHFTDEPHWVDKTRKRLANLSWFMKCLKEPIARRANREDDVTGAFWEGRFKSIAVLDETSLLSTAAYIDLNPLAAGAALTPEESAHTSLRVRLDHCESNGSDHNLHEDLSTLTRNPAQEAGLWLLPLDDGRADGAGRPGLMVGCTLSFYLSVVDATSRMVRGGKATLDAHVAPIFQRLALDQRMVEHAINKLFQPRRRTANTLGAKISRPSGARGGRPLRQPSDSPPDIDRAEAFRFGRTPTRPEALLDRR